MLDAVREMKTSRLAFTRWMCGQPLRGKVGIPIINSTGLPKVLPVEARALLKKRDKDFIRFVLTLLTVSRGILGGSPVDYTPITNPPVITAEPTDFEIIRGLQDLGLPRSHKRPLDKGGFKFS